MSFCRPQAFVESLESRRLAASGERITTVVDAPKPSSTVLHYQTGQAVDVTKLPRLRVGVDAGGTVVVRGAGGDDNVRIRVIRGGLEIRTNTRWSYTYYTSNRAGRTVPMAATTTFENVYKFGRHEFSSLSIYGNRGADSLRFTGTLPFNPTFSSIESVALTPNFPELPAGQTPSDAATRPGGWLKRVADEKGYADNRATQDVALFGDSHVAHFLDWGENSWKYKLRKPAVFGIGGDDTRHLLYRIENGLFDTYKPSKLVVSVGTNNFNNPQTGGTDEQIFQGVMKVMTELRERLPDSELVLISLLPRPGLGLNARIEALHGRLDDVASAAGFEFLNLYARFNTLTKREGPDRSYTSSINPFGNDSHYNSIGYGILGDSLAQLLKLWRYAE